eukprot:NODE_777_length_3963_cov_1.034161.p3 type:complete len:297 gc:universal NODE_777_length_3963_cov_1.034161:2858-1968(-)
MLETAKTVKYCQKHLQLMPNAYQRSIHSYSTIVQFIYNLLFILSEDESILPKEVVKYSSSPHPWIQTTSTSGIYAYITMAYHYKWNINNDTANRILIDIKLNYGKFNNYDQNYDLRFIYTCLASLEILKMMNDNIVDQVDKYLNSIKTFTLKFVHDCQDLTGGYSMNDMEPHAGYTYCAIGSLLILNENPRNEWKLKKWLILRQQKDGGINGRLNKPSDTCYSFWVGASLKMLKSLEFLNIQKLKDFLIQSQSAMGGFGKTAEDFPDPMHSYLGTIGYFMLENNDLNPILNIACRR